MELSLTAALVIAVLLAWVALAGAWDAFSRTPWLDECVTLLIVGDPYGYGDPGAAHVRFEHHESGLAQADD